MTRGIVARDGVVETQLAAIGLSRENVPLIKRRLRLRILTVAPDGRVMLHGHENRAPAFVTINPLQVAKTPGTREDLQELLRCFGVLAPPLCLTMPPSFSL